MVAPDTGNAIVAGGAGAAGSADAAALAAPACPWRVEEPGGAAAPGGAPKRPRPPKGGAGAVTRLVTRPVTRQPAGVCWAASPGNCIAPASATTAAAVTAGVRNVALMNMPYVTTTGEGVLLLACEVTMTRGYAAPAKTLPDTARMPHYLAT